MARSYKFAIIRLAPDDMRDERINIGVIISDGTDVDVRLSKRLEKVRAISHAVDPGSVRAVAENLRELNAEFRNSGVRDEDERLRALRQVGPLSLSSAGEFLAQTETAYEDRINAILTNFIDPEPAPRRVQARRSKLVTQVKKMFRQQRVLALRDEDLASHRIVSAMELADGLVADFVLQNGAMHVVETVDASGEDEPLRRVVIDIAVSALTLEQARINFGEKNTQTKLVYDASPALELRARPSLEAAQHQGTELINWASRDDRLKFVTSMSSLAVPIERKTKKMSLVVPFADHEQRRMFLN